MWFSESDKLLKCSLTRCELPCRTKKSLFRCSWCCPTSATSRYKKRHVNSLSLFLSFWESCFSFFLSQHPSLSFSLSQRIYLSLHFLQKSLSHSLGISKKTERFCFCRVLNRHDTWFEVAILLLNVC